MLCFHLVVQYLCYINYFHLHNTLVSQDAELVVDRHCISSALLVHGLWTGDVVGSGHGSVGLTDWDDRAGWQNISDYLC